MGAAASSSSSSPAAVAGGSSLLLAPTRPVAGRWAAVTDGTARGGDTVLSILEGEGGQEQGALRLQGSLGALEGNGGRLVGFSIADCAVDPAALSQARAGTQGLRLAYRHDPPDARFQLRLLSRGLAPQESFVAPLLSSTTQQAAPGATTTVIIPYSAFRLQYRGRPLEDRAGERVDPSALTSVGIEVTRSSQPPPLYARAPLPFEFILLSPGIEAVP